MVEATIEFPGDRISEDEGRERGAGGGGGALLADRSHRRSTAGLSSWIDRWSI